MPWNFDTKRFDPPMLLVDILAFSKPDDQVCHVQDFLDYKVSPMRLSLSRSGRMFQDTVRLYDEIASDGWSSPFDQIYTWDQFSDIMKVLAFCGHPDAASLIGEARNIYFRGRDDLTTMEERVEAGLDGRHLTPEEASRFYDIGAAFEKLAESRYYPDLIKWVHKHSDQFTEFTRA